MMAVLGLHDSIADEDHPPAVGGDSGSGGGFDPVVIGKLNGTTRAWGRPVQKASKSRVARDFIPAIIPKAVGVGVDAR